MKLYKVRHKLTGLLSRGGTSPCWNSKGKTWNTLGYLKSHLRYIDKHKQADMVHWEVLEIEVSEQLQPIGMANDIIAESVKKAADLERERQEASRREEEERKSVLSKLTPKEKRLLGLA